MARPFVSPPPRLPRSEWGRPSRWREIACRSCGAWMRLGDDGRWYHVDVDTIACVDPATLAPYEP